MSSHLRCQTLLICVAAALLPLGAQAIEPSSTVKVTQLLKTTMTWNGVPIQYPEGQAEVTSLILKLIVFYAGAVDKQPLSVPRPEARPKTN